LDDQITIAHLRELVQDFISEREWQPYQDPKNLTMSIAIEAAELLEIYQWLTNEQAATAGKRAKARQQTREELSDVVIYCLALANALDIDLSQAIAQKMASNAVKYPTATSRGKLG
jgi:NTP pyrophosphatase (non-canonical NTP hydrolase)